jgi:hypothetical protein
MTLSISQEDFLRILEGKFDENFQQICIARKAMLVAIEAEEDAKEALKDRESALLILGKDGPINGSNDKQRDAQMRDATLTERIAVVEASKDKRLAEYKLQLCIDARRNLENVLKIEEIGKR